jgi:hypothetical protein
VIERCSRSAPPPMGHGCVKRNAIQPSIKRTMLLERLQLEECLDQRLLDDVAGILGMADHVHERVVQPILILQDQLSKGVRLPLQGLVDQLGVVTHSRLTLSDAPRGGGSSRAGYATKSSKRLSPEEDPFSQVSRQKTILLPSSLGRPLNLADLASGCQTPYAPVVWYAFYQTTGEGSSGGCKAPAVLQRVKASPDHFTDESASRMETLVKRPTSEIEYAKENGEVGWCS